MKKVLHVVGARPNFVKIAPVIRALESIPGLEQRLVHTGQHYDDQMSEAFFRDLELPRPDRDLNAGSGPDDDRASVIQTRVEQVLREERPDLVVVVGDVSSTIAAAGAAAALDIPVAHIEAGLRSFDLSMPEEVNRIATDRLASVLFTPSPDADANLIQEGIPESRIHFVGNVMIDTLLRHRSKAPWAAIRDRFGLTDRRFALLTLHRPANVDAGERLAMILARIEPLSREFPILFPVHPRTARRIVQSGLEHGVEFLTMTDPLGYIDFLAAMDHAAFVLTDSGGIQEETTVLNVPCFTLRDNTERPITIEQGTNTLVGADARDLAHAFVELQRSGGKRGRIPEKWDGAAGTRVARVIADVLTRPLVRP